MIECIYCGRDCEMHPSGLGVHCPVCGFIPDLCLKAGAAGARWTPSEEAKVDMSIVPEWDVIVIGTESKGRVKVHIPVDATDIEAKRRIDKRLTWLYYCKTAANDMGLDIQPGKREVKE